MKRKIYAMAMLWPILTLFMCSVTQAQGNSASGVAEPAALGKDTIVPLQIGDTIPEALWHLPLQLVYPSGSIVSTSLSEWRGKLIILDFMGLWCASCIKALPKLNALQQTYGERMQTIITTDDDISDLKQFYVRNAVGNAVKLPAIAQDSILRRYFPFKAVSHLVWISPSGVLASTTGTSYAQARYAEHILNGKKADWTPKIDELHFDYQRPLFTSSQIPLANANARSIVPFYAVFTGPIQGVQPRTLTVADSSSATIRRAFINISLHQLIHYAVGTHPLLIPDDHVVWRVENQNRYRYKPKPGTHKTDWMLNNAYTYEIVYPDGGDANLWQDHLSTDLRRYFPGLDFELTNDTLYISDHPQTFKAY